MTSPRWVWLSQHALPKNLLSRIVRRATRSSRPWLARPLIRWFARTYRIAIDEAEQPNLDSYATFNEFFTRALKAGARPIAPGARTLISPADGVLTELGRIEDGLLLQAKGRHYPLSDLLGETGDAVDSLHSGTYLTIYLAPSDYHRVHAPLAASLERTRYLPGERFSVSRATAGVIDRLFCRNERVVCWFDTAHGPLAVVLVGALNVSCVSTFTRGEIESGPPREWREPQAVHADKGSEIGRFNMGSTVIVIFGGALDFEAGATSGSSVRMGQALATVSAS